MQEAEATPNRKDRKAMAKKLKIAKARQSPPSDAKLLKHAKPEQRQALIMCFALRDFEAARANLLRAAGFVGSGRDWKDGPSGEPEGVWFAMEKAFRRALKASHDLAGMAAKELL